MVAVFQRTQIGVHHSQCRQPEGQYHQQGKGYKAFTVFLADALDQLPQPVHSHKKIEVVADLGMVFPQLHDQGRGQKTQPQQTRFLAQPEQRPDHPGYIHDGAELGVVPDLHQPQPVAGKHEGHRAEKACPHIQLEMAQEEKHAQSTHEQQEDTPVDHLVRELGKVLQKRPAVGKGDHVGRHAAEHALRPQGVVRVGLVVFYDLVCRALPLCDIRSVFGCVALERHRKVKQAHRDQQQRHQRQRQIAGIPGGSAILRGLHGRSAFGGGFGKFGVDRFLGHNILFSEIVPCIRIGACHSVKHKMPPQLPIQGEQHDI